MPKLRNETNERNSVRAVQEKESPLKRKIESTEGFY